MGVYIKLFETQNDFKDEYYGEGYGEPWLSLTLENDDVRYNKSEREKLLETPLTFEITSDGVIKWNASSNNLTRKIEYKKNGGEWTSITSTTAGVNINVVNGDTVQFRGDNATYATATNVYNRFSGTTASFNVKGNIMSLIDSDDYAGVSSLTSSYTFAHLFIDCTGLTDASKLVLPATTLTDSCYYGMFSGCTSLTKAPELPATTLTNACYFNMFNGCTSITTAPELPATTLANYCYCNMFRDCTSLTTTPELPATTLAEYCYGNMFWGCMSLTTAPELPATTLAEYCYNYMFWGCTSLTTTPELPATTLANYCYQYMFNNCTSITKAPELPATTLARYCYSNMFAGCTSLNYNKCLATDISAMNCTDWWVSGVASSGTFVKASSMTGWDTGANGIPSNWTVQDA